MVCFWYENNYGKDICNYRVGYGFDKCLYNGDVCECPDTDHGQKIAEERVNLINNHVEISIEAYKKMKVADEKPIDYEAIKKFKEDVKEIEKNICSQKDTCELDTDYKLIATKLRYSITNAINKKYKNMTDNEDDVSALMRLMGMRICLIKNGFLKAEDFEYWGE